MQTAAAPGRPLTQAEIFRFWTPLAATWLMMAVEGPFLAALIARLADPKPNLAGFGVSLSFALLLEAPVIMLMAAGTALVRDAETLRRLRRFTWVLNGLVTAVLVVVLLPPVYAVLSGPIMGLPTPVDHLAHVSLALFLPWPAAIGYRRLYQGVLIQQNLTRRVGYGTAVRLAAMTATALVLFRLQVPGAYLAAAALSAGVLAEAAACRAMVHPSLRKLRSTGSAAPPPSYREILAFYQPLMLSSMLMLGVHPTMTFFMAQGRAPLESLAVFPVVRSLVFVFSCLGLSYQEVGIALMGQDGAGYQPLRRFAATLGLASSLGLAAIALTPLSRVWYADISGLPPDLLAFALLPTLILTAAPGLTVMLSFQRSIFVWARITRPITRATMIEVGLLAGLLMVAIHRLDMVGVTAAALALVAGRTASNGVLFAARHLARPGTVDRLAGRPLD